MKASKLLSFLLVIITVLSCKDEKNPDAEQSQDKLPETFNVAFTLTVPEDDTFELYYTQDGTLNFGVDAPVKTLVKGSDAPQEVLFKLPENVLPSNIRLDFGNNKSQGAIKVGGIRLKYFDKKFEEKGDVVKKYFYFNDFQVKYDEKAGTMVPVVPTGNAIYDPLMWSNELLGVELKKIVK
jgi:hypothetical protein